MARYEKKTEGHGQVVTDADTPGLPAMVEAADMMAQIETAYTEDRDLMNQLLGQIQMSQAIGKLTTVVGLQKLKTIKELKLYKAFAGKALVDSEGKEITDVGCWSGFCRLIGSSQQKVDEDLLNLRTFGEDAMDSLTRVGAGYRELRQLRKLPEDQQTALIEVARLGDKESFVELAEEIITRHAKEKESLSKRAEDSEADLEASRQRVAVKETEVEKLTGEVLKLKRRVETQAPDEAAADIRKEADLFAFRAEHAIRGELRPAFQTLEKHAAEHGGNHAEFMLGLVAQIERAANELRAEFDLVKALPDGDQTPYWMRDDVQAQVKADAEAQTPEWLKQQGGEHA